MGKGVALASLHWNARVYQSHTTLQRNTFVDHLFNGLQWDLHWLHSLLSIRLDPRRQPIVVPCISPPRCGPIVQPSPPSSPSSSSSAPTPAALPPPPSSSSSSSSTTTYFSSLVAYPHPCRLPNSQSITGGILLPICSEGTNAGGGVDE
jgi:hypothetical protein